MSGINKRPAYMHAKEFKLPKILGNLQGYKIATGQVRKEEIEDVSKKYGSDEGAIFGSLITDASGVKSAKGPNRPPSKKSRKKKSRKRKKDPDDQSTHKSTKTSTQPSSVCEEPLVIPAALLTYSDSDDDESEIMPQSSESSADSKSSDEETGSFFGLVSRQENVQAPAVMPLIPTAQPGNPGSETQRASCDVDINSTERLPAAQPLSSSEPVLWDNEKLKFTSHVSNLSTYKCYKCRRVGHLPQDCTAYVSTAAVRTSGLLPGACEQPSQTIYTRRLKDYYHKCQKLRQSKGIKCAECGTTSNIASCLECGLALCDGRGHLLDHLVEYPSHTKLYSHKLQRQVKCCKSTCEVMDADMLFTCSACLDKAFCSHYSMVNATWSRAGLKAIPNALACEQHFHWHRMNCSNPTQEPLVSRQKLEISKCHGDGLLSEFFF